MTELEKKMDRESFAKIEYTHDNSTEIFRVDRLKDTAVIWYRLVRSRRDSEQISTELIMPIRVHDWKGELQLYYSDYQPSVLEMDTWRQVWELFRECKENVKFYVQKVETYELN